MLLSEKILIKKRGNKNIKYYSDLGYNTSLDEFVIDVNHLTNSSKYLVDIECDFCGNNVERMYYLYLKNISSNCLFACSPKCARNKTIKTNLERYGSESATQSKEVREKTIKTNPLDISSLKIYETKAIKVKLSNAALIILLYSSAPNPRIFVSLDPLNQRKNSHEISINAATVIFLNS